MLKEIEPNARPVCFTNYKAFVKYHFHFQFIHTNLIYIITKYPFLYQTVDLCPVWLVWFMVFNATFNNMSVISWLSVLLVEETGVHEENY